MYVGGVGECVHYCYVGMHVPTTNSSDLLNAVHIPTVVTCQTLPPLSCLPAGPTITSVF